MTEQEKKALQDLIDASHDARFVVENGKLVLQLIHIEVSIAPDATFSVVDEEADAFFGWELSDADIGHTYKGLSNG